jgi:hypothetical protein
MEKVDNQRNPEFLQRIREVEQRDHKLSRQQLRESEAPIFYSVSVSLWC